MESGKVDGGGLVVSSGQTAPLLELVDASLNGVALLVRLAVEGRWATAGSLVFRTFGITGSVNGRALSALPAVCRSCFTAPTFRTFCVLLTGLIAQTRRRTVCGMLLGTCGVP